MGRRDKNDVKWQECKRKVYEMDKSQCLLCQCLTVKEAMISQKNPTGFSTTKIDPAHYKAASQHPELIYDPSNVFCICRRHHEALDHGRDPVTGDYCTADVTESYWQRIIAKRKENLANSADVTLLGFYYDGKEKTEPVKDSVSDITDMFVYDEL